MATISYTVQRPGEGPAILNACRLLANATAFERLTGLYAFATHKGARLLSAALEGDCASWPSAYKRWVISIDGGITEPEALRFLLNLRRSEVRVHDAEQLLIRRLRPIRRFHPKTLLLEHPISPPQAVGILVGSANLTFNGLCLGHEHAMTALATGTSTRAAMPATMSAGLAELERAIDSATVIGDDFVNRYAAVRPARPRPPAEPEDPRADLILQDHAVILPTRSAALAAANHLWINIDYVVANRGRREEGNQIDMQRGTRVFFGFGDRALPRNSPIGSVRILYGGHSASRNLRFGNNQMDKLDLPIPGTEGPPSYSDETLLFTRESRASFRLTVGTAAEIADWKSRSRAADTLFRMRSAREFGVF